MQTKDKTGVMTEAILTWVNENYPDAQEVDYTDMYFTFCKEIIPDNTLAFKIQDYFKQLYGEPNEEK